MLPCSVDAMPAVEHTVQTGIASSHQRWVNKHTIPFSSNFELVLLYVYIRCSALGYVQSETASGLMGYMN
jgi:hypothetical protein